MPTVPDAVPAEQDTLAPGTVLENRYEILRVCGQGGMSTVYVARDLRFSHVERLCAVKEMVDRARDHQTRMLRMANFEREASLLATLSHPAIPKIYDYFSLSGLIYLVLEFIDGEDLEHLIAPAPMPRSRRARSSNGPIRFWTCSPTSTSISLSRSSSVI